MFIYGWYEDGIWKKIETVGFEINYDDNMMTGNFYWFDDGD